MEILGKDPEKINKVLDSMLEEAKEFRRPLENSWRKNEQYLRSRFPRPQQQHKSNVYTNHVYRVIQQFTTLLTDSRPHFTVTVRGRGKWAVTLQKALQSRLARWWQEYEVDRIIGLSIPWLYTHGKIYWKIVWDPQLREPRIIPVSPWDVFVDPNARRLEDADWICQRSIVSIWELLRRYPPEVLEGVKTRKDLSSYQVTAAEHEISRYGFPIGPDSAIIIPERWPVERVPIGSRISAIEKTEYEEWIIRDPTRLPDGKPAYPVARVIIRAGGKILADGNYPYWDNWPGWWVEAFANYAGASVYGHPEIDQWISIQEALNVVVRLAVDNVRFLTPGLWKMDRGAIPPGAERSLTPDVARILQKRQGMEVARETGQVPPANFEIINILRGELLYLTGLSEASAGRPPRSVTSAAAIESLGQTTITMARSKARELESMLTQAGIRFLSRIIQFSSMEDFSEILLPFVVGKETPEQEMDPSEILKAAGIDDWSYNSRYSLVRDLRISARPGSSLAAQREMDARYWLALYQSGLVSRSTVREILEIPGRDEDEQLEIAQAMVGSPTAQAKLGPTPRGRGATASRLIRR